MNPKCVLIVEDEFLVALDMETILGEAGFDVLGPAGSVSEALRLLAVRQPDAALLDNNLNGESARAVANALTAKHVPFAFVSGNDRASLPPEFSSVVLVRKPYDATRLVEAAVRLTV
jgi:DNA-binding NarL/FixJ family response regulator